jgi:hypothetical protein
MNRKTLAIVLIVLAAGLLGYWAASGAETWTLQQVQEKVVDPNDPFQQESIVWKDEFRPGLLDMIGPAAGVLVLIAGFLFWSDARRRRSQAVHTAPSGPRTT